MVARVITTLHAMRATATISGAVDTLEKHLSLTWGPTSVSNGPLKKTFQIVSTFSARWYNNSYVLFFKNHSPVFQVKQRDFSQGDHAPVFHFGQVSRPEKLKSNSHFLFIAKGGFKKKKLDFPYHIFEQLWVDDRLTSKVQRLQRSKGLNRRNVSRCHLIWRCTEQRALESRFRRRSASI